LKTESYFVKTQGGELSGRFTGPMSRPRGMVVALHGGTYDSGYYDTGSGPSWRSVRRWGCASSHSTAPATA